MLPDVHLKGVGHLRTLQEFCVRSTISNPPIPNQLRFCQDIVHIIRSFTGTYRFLLDTIHIFVAVFRNISVVYFPFIIFWVAAFFRI